MHTMKLISQDTRTATERNKTNIILRKCANDTLKIMLYVVFMTILIILYCNYENEKFDKSVDCYHSYHNEVITSQSKIDSKSFTRIDNVKKGYVVWSDSCRIPNISAYDKSIKHLIEKSNPPKCSSKLPLTSVVLDAEKWLYTFKINHAVLSKTPKPIIKCCYSSIFRKRLKFKNSLVDDDSYKVEQKCHPINDSEIVPESVEYMVVTCELIRPANGGKPKSTAVYKDTHAMVVDKGQRNFRNADVPEKPSVLIIAIDSLSRLNLIRSMPVTHRLLEARGFMSLDGYTKVADNTFPNVVSILTGMFESQMRERCWKRPTDEMDGCPFLWNDFKKRGYVTAYVEDEPAMGTFNYGKYGFRNPPTDYYSRPYMLAAEHLLPVVRFNGMSYCLGPRSVPDRVYGYIEDFVRLHRRHGYFAVFWLNAFSHNELNSPSSADQRTADTLSRLLDGRLLDNAVAVVLSDHGLRFGEIRETRVGWLEERMPALYARLPPGHVAAMPGHRAALAANRYRLTSPFDLHLTLKQLLLSPPPGGDRGGGAADDAAVVQRADGCPTCRSLFSLADANRSCEQAGIVSHWCTCDAFEELDGSAGTTAADISRHAVQQLNGLLDKYKALVRAGYACAKLSLRRAVSARSRTNRRTGDLEYLVIVETVPGHSLFEVTFDRRRRDGRLGALADISRINMYGFQSHCTNDWRLKKHCYCVKNARELGR